MAEVAGDDSLPPEATLPQSSPLGGLPEPQNPPAVNNDTPSELPDESLLPTGDATPPPAALVTLGEAEQLLRLEQSEDARPWLRLIAKAPLDRVRSLSFSSDSRRLFAAGDDKEVISYRRADDGTYHYERTLRWQIQRGPVGRIYTTSVAGGSLAFGGYSAMGSLGEIALFDAATGKLQQTLANLDAGHRQRLTSLCFAPAAENPTLASMDQNGRLLIWTKDARTGLWQSRQIAYEPTQAESLQLDRTLHPITMLDQHRVVAPVFEGRPSETSGARWGLRIYDAANAAHVDLTDEGTTHLGLVTAMATNTTGSRLASADAHGQLFLWNVANGSSTKHQLGTVATSLAFSTNGRTLAVGTGFSGQRKTLLWDTSNPRIPKPLREQTVRSDVLACSISPDNRWLAYSQGSQIHLQNLGRRATESIILRSLVPVIDRVAFSRQPPYRIAIGHRPADASVAENDRRDARPFHVVFDPQNGQLDPTPVLPQEWLPVTDGMGWELKINSEHTQAWLEHQGDRRGILTLNPRTDGMPTTHCWLHRDGQPWAVVVASSGNNNLFVFQLVQQGPCPLLRVFRGHTGSIRTMAASHDQRYLISAAATGIIRVWKLEGLEENPLVNRWGANFRITDEQLVVDSIRTDGPLYFRGLRTGDSLQRLLHVDVERGREVVSSVVEPAEMLSSLTERDPGRLTGFSYRRGRAPTVSFQSYPAWQPVANVFVNQQREWAFWTPAGVYDASFEGHKLFGWQVNRGPALPPDFFLAAQVRGFLEKPQVMSRLLAAGDLEQAFQQAKVGTPGNWSILLAQQRAMIPQVEILEPTASTTVNTPTLVVRARVRSHRGQSLVSPKAFVNGVVGTGRQQIGVRRDGDFVETDFSWNVALPSDPELLVQVVIATEDEVTGQASLRLQQAAVAKRKRPRLFVLACGINRYRDAQIPQLRHAVDNVLGLCTTLQTKASPLYSTSILSLADGNVTRGTWEVTLETMAEQLGQQVTPNDLLVVFLSGHGVRDGTTDEYYYVTAEAAYRDVVASRYADCLSVADFSAFAHVPCRKLVILDTCHSGAFQPLRQRELKYALRALQDDVFFTLTASEGGQEAIESSEQRLSRFTYRLLEGLQGAADTSVGNRDAVVTFQEVIDYVQRTVPADAESSKTIQFPTAGPTELLDLIVMPLTQTNASVAQAEGTNTQH